MAKKKQSAQEGQVAPVQQQGASSQTDFGSNQERAEGLGLGGEAGQDEASGATLPEGEGGWILELLQKVSPDLVTFVELGVSGVIHEDIVASFDDFLSLQDFPQVDDLFVCFEQASNTVVDSLIELRNLPDLCCGTTERLSTAMVEAVEGLTNSVTLPAEFFGQLLRDSTVSLGALAEGVQGQLQAVFGAAWTAAQSFFGAGLAALRKVSPTAADYVEDLLNIDWSWSALTELVSEALPEPLSELTAFIGGLKEMAENSGVFDALMNGISTMNGMLEPFFWYLANYNDPNVVMMAHAALPDSIFPAMLEQAFFIEGLFGTMGLHPFFSGWATIFSESSHLVHLAPMKNLLQSSAEGFHWVANSSLVHELDQVNGRVHGYLSDVGEIAKSILTAVKDPTQILDFLRSIPFAMLPACIAAPIVDLLFLGGITLFRAVLPNFLPPVLWSSVTYVAEALSESAHSMSDDDKREVLVHLLLLPPSAPDFLLGFMGGLFDSGMGLINDIGAGLAGLVGLVEPMMKLPLAAGKLVDALTTEHPNSSPLPYLSFEMPSVQMPTEFEPLDLSEFYELGFLMLDELVLGMVKWAGSTFLESLLAGRAIYDVGYLAAEAAVMAFGGEMFAAGKKALLSTEVLASDILMQVEVIIGKVSQTTDKLIQRTEVLHALFNDTTIAIEQLEAWITGSLPTSISNNEAMVLLLGAVKGRLMKWLDVVISWAKEVFGLDDNSDITPQPA